MSVQYRTLPTPFNFCLSLSRLSSSTIMHKGSSSLLGCTTSIQSQPITLPSDLCKGTLSSRLITDISSSVVIKIACIFNLFPGSNLQLPMHRRFLRIHRTQKSHSRGLDKWFHNPARISGKWDTREVLPFAMCLASF